jgi:uncharacterized protein (TIGR02147 family)
MDSPDAPNVFRYLDARRYLADYYAFKKASGRGFSYRAFSRRAGLGSPNYLKLVIDGDRNLTPEMAVRFAGACGLVDKAATYFIDLVAFTQASQTDEKAARYERLIRFREHREVHKIDVAFGQYHSHWYIPAIRELAFRADFQADSAWIAPRLLPRIKESEAREALALLLDLALLTQTDGRWHPAEALVTTGAEVRGLHYMQYHRTMIGRALTALDERPPADRDISSVTLCLDKDGIRRLKERIRAFRQELLQMSADEKHPERVVQVNFQLFPLTQDTSGVGNEP